MLYFEDYASLRATLDGDDVLAVLDAMVAYAEESELPIEENLSQAARICWRFMRPKLDRDAQAYQKKSESRRAAANKRWGAEAAKAPDYANDANACKCIEGMQEMQAQNFMPTATATTTASATAAEDTRAMPAPPASEMQTLRENHRRAEQIIRRYGLPDNDLTLEAVLEDAEAHGWDKLEAALQTAALSNSRQKISVVFYRSILTAEPRKEKTGARADPYANYERF